MKINVNGQLKEIALKAWNGEQYTPDFFADVADIEINFPIRDAEGYPVLTADEYKETVAWWGETIRDANTGVWTEIFGERDPDLGELVLFADEV